MADLFFANERSPPDIRSYMKIVEHPKGICVVVSCKRRESWAVIITTYTSTVDNVQLRRYMWL